LKAVAIDNSKGGVSILRSHLTIALLIFLVAVALRLSYQRSAIVHNPIRADARQYYLNAYNLFHFGVYSVDAPDQSGNRPRTSWRRTPGYPLFLYPFFYFSKTPTEFVVNVSLAQAILGSLTCALVFYLGLSFLTPFWAVIAGLASALSPHLIAMDDFLLSESLFMFTLVAATLALVQSFRQRSSGLAFISGALFCFSALVRAVSGLLGLFMFLCFLVAPRYWKKGGRFNFLVPTTCFLIGLAVIHLPYSHIRRQIIANADWVTNESAWQHVVIGADINLDNFFRNKRIPEFKNQTEKMINDRSYGLTVLRQRFQENPAGYLKWYLGGKLLFMWKWDNVYNGDVYQYPMVVKGFHQENWLAALHRFMRWLHWPSIALAIMGIGLFLFNWFRNNLAKSEYLLLAPILVFIYFAIIFTILLPLPRYMIPVRPFVYLIGCYPLLLSSRYLNRFLFKNA
jgi:4-amino-4-deoxy-L-arabinose transferase-like glycosyltransferase